MPCFIDTPTCDEFSDGTGSWQGWVGLTTDENDPGQSCGCCCGIGCGNCDEGNLPGARALKTGKRWMRGSQDLVDAGIEAVTYDGRGSRGQIIAVKENMPARRILPGLVVDKAPCFIEGGFECYDAPNGLCDCAGEQFACGPGDEDCVYPGVPCSGKRADSFTYKGFDWLSGNGDQICRETTEKQEKILFLFSKRMFSPVFVRDTFNGAPFQQCGVNRMILCAGVNLFANVDQCGYENEFGTGPDIDAHYIAPHHQMWNFCTIEYQGLGLTDWGDPSPKDGAVRELKQAALDRIQQIPELSQLDYYPLASQLNGSPSANEHLDDWHRSYGFGVPAEPLIPITTVAVLENCRLRRSGARVRVEYFIREAYCSMSLVPYITSDTGLEKKLWPHARFRIYLIMGMRATFPDGAPVVGTNPAITLGIEHPDDHLSPPRIVPNIDEIVYVTEVDGEEVEFIPPREVDWWGYHGEYGLVPFNGVQMVETSQDSLGACCRAATWLHGLEVHRWPTHADGGEVDSIYTGHVKLGFVTSNWCGRCGTAHPECNGGGGGAGTQVGGARFIPPLGIQPSPITPGPIGRPPERITPPVARPEPDLRIRPQRPVAFNPERFRPVADPPIQQPEQPDSPPRWKPPVLGPNEQGFTDADHTIWQN